jgi:hypothetical protein
LYFVASAPIYIYPERKEEREMSVEGRKLTGTPLPSWVGEFETVQDVAASAARLMSILMYNHQLMMRDYEEKFAAIQDEIATLKQQRARCP